MFPYLILIFTVLPALELAVLIKIGAQIGVGSTLMIIILTGVAGAALARYQGFIILNKIQQELNKGQMPSSQLMDGLMILVGGITLLTPGFITDTIGLLLLIPLTRNIIKYWFTKRFQNMIDKGELVTFRQSDQKKTQYDDFDIT